MKHENKPIHLEALESQLEFLKGRIQEPNAAHWRKIGKLAQDFTVWLERARPWISCASNLIALRVEQVIGDVDPQQPSETSLKKLSNLLEEAGRQLAKPGLPIQVIDLEKAAEAAESGLQDYTVRGGIELPSNMVEIPDLLRPEGNPPVHFLYLIPN